MLLLRMDLHSAAIIGFPAFLGETAHLFIVEHRPHLFAPLVLLLGDNAFPLLGHGELDHLQVAAQQSVYSG